MDDATEGLVRVGVAMTRIGLFALMAVAGTMVFAAKEPAHAQTVAPQFARPAASELSAQRRIRRRPTPIYIYGHRPLSPTAVRACESWYAQEFRPSGTVIVPRMSCHWVDR